MSVKITGETLKKASQEGVDTFLSVFIDAYLNVTGNKLNSTTMPLLNGWQHSLLSYHYFREEVMQGGFVQLIQNGYGSYIFKNPFAKSLKIFGAEELSKIVYKAKEIYDKHQKDLERETTDEEFHAMYEQYEAFDDLEERFYEIEEDCTSVIAYYVDKHIEDFAEIES
jgi:hypothetical protein